ncbi:MAG: 3-oxoacyl-ACP reductase FabG [Oscillospiraceae bacterium]|jgi:3-oxoacyl-[acyl-carrier protein] reductase|nr:3-oxoacyl-ACP reductase FabG [Oscillospiraceae bacterium]
MSTALVTGASGAIGRAIARRLAEEGHSVLCHGNLHSAAGLAALCVDVQADLSREDEIERLFDEAERRFGGVDILVNNAGIALPQQLITETETADYDKLFAVNMRGAFLCARRALPHMIHQKQGRVINISSVWGVVGGSCEVAYSASKAALIGFTKALAKEVAPSGITVNCVAPGVIESPMNAHLDVAALARETPLGRIGRPEEVADAVAYFVKADFATGQVLLVDGGFHWG